MLAPIGSAGLYECFMSASINSQKTLVELLTFKHTTLEFLCKFYNKSSQWCRQHNILNLERNLHAGRVASISLAGADLGVVLLQDGGVARPVLLVRDVATSTDNPHVSTH